MTRKITRAVAAIADGNDVRLVLGNLDARRDWGFAGDYAEALVRIARHDEPRDFVVATGVSRSIADFVRLAFAHVGIEDWQHHVDVDPALQRAGDAGEQRGDASLAHRVLGWEPTVDLARARRADGRRRPGGVLIGRRSGTGTDFVVERAIALEIRC